MLQKIKKSILVLFALSGLLFPLAVPAVTFADSNLIQNGVCNGANNLNITNQAAATGNTCQTDTATASTDNFQTLLTKIINIFSIIVGVVAVIMIVVGGFRYITSGGTSEKVTAAKNTILYALIGLIIVALAQVIVKFVLNKATSA